MTRSRLLLSALICLCFGNTCHAESQAKFTCHRACAPIAIDGKLDDAAWNRADIIKFAAPVSGKEPLSKTDAWLLWDDSYFYVAFRAYDKDVWSLYKGRDSETCSDDCLECFILPDPSKPTYHNFETNVLGTVYDAYNFGKNIAGGTRRWGAWDCEGLRIGITVSGTLNNWADTDQSWQMELAIPLAELPDLHGKGLNAGDTWKILLARYDYSVYLPDGVELSCSSRLSKVDFHLPSDWAQLVFKD